MSDNRDIPLPLRRQVRQACGFGCAICGIPIGDYHHIIEFSIVESHDFDNLIFLCDNHHRMVKYMPVELIREFKNKPINLKTGTSNPLPFYLLGNEFNLFVGNNHYSKIFYDQTITYPIIVDDKPLISVKAENNELLISLSIYDERGNPLFIIDDNQIVFSAGDNWDVVSEGTTWTVRSALHHITFEINIDVFKRLIIIRRGRFYFNNWQVDISMRNGVGFNKGDNGSRINGMSIGSNPSNAFGFVVHDDRSVSNGLVLGDCPTFDEVPCMFRWSPGTNS